MQYIDAIEWLKQVIITTANSCPMAVRERTSTRAGRFVISLAIEEGPLSSRNRGDRVMVHVRSKSFNQEYVAARQAVRMALREIEHYTRHMFPDYHYFKLKALEANEPDVRHMPKRISPQFAYLMVCFKALMVDVSKSSFGA